MMVYQSIIQFPRKNLLCDGSDIHDSAERFLK